MINKKYFSYFSIFTGTKKYFQIKEKYNLLKFLFSLLTTQHKNSLQKKKNFQNLLTNRALLLIIQKSLHIQTLPIVFPHLFRLNSVMALLAFLLESEPS